MERLSIDVEGGRIEVGERDCQVQARDRHGCFGATLFTEQPTAIVLFRVVLDVAMVLMYNQEFAEARNGAIEFKLLAPIVEGDRTSTIRRGLRITSV